MRDLKAEYIRLIKSELLDLLQEQMDRIRGDTINTPTISESIDKFANKIYDINNADFEDNFNNDHAEEQNNVKKPF